VQRGFAGELGAGELHAVTGVARETHDGILDVDVRPGAADSVIISSCGAEPTGL